MLRGAEKLGSGEEMRDKERTAMVKAWPSYHPPQGCPSIDLSE